jgi:hypothetical protein
LVKEYNSYDKESKEWEEKINNLKTEGADEGHIKKQVKGL